MMNLRFVKRSILLVMMNLRFVKRLGGYKVIRLCRMQEYKVQSTTALRNAIQRSSLTSLVYSYLITRLLFLGYEVIRSLHL